MQYCSIHPTLSKKYVKKTSNAYKNWSDFIFLFLNMSNLSFQMKFQQQKFQGQIWEEPLVSSSYVHTVCFKTGLPQPSASTVSRGRQPQTSGEMVSTVLAMVWKCWGKGRVTGLELIFVSASFMLRTMASTRSTFKPSLQVKKVKSRESVACF